MYRKPLYIAALIPFLAQGQACADNTTARVLEYSCPPTIEPVSVPRPGQPTWQYTGKLVETTVSAGHKSITYRAPLTYTNEGGQDTNTQGTVHEPDLRFQFTEGTEQTLNQPYIIGRGQNTIDFSGFNPAPRQAKAPYSFLKGSVMCVPVKAVVALPKTPVHKSDFTKITSSGRQVTAHYGAHESDVADTLTLTLPVGWGVDSVQGNLVYIKSNMKHSASVGFAIPAKTMRAVQHQIKATEKQMKAKKKK